MRHLFQDHTTCFQCNRPIDGEYFHFENADYCSRCFHRLQKFKCVICNQPLKQSYLEDAWRNKYCTSHREHIVACFSCSDIVNKYGCSSQSQYEDHTLCARCAGSVVRDSVALTKAWEAVCAYWKLNGIELDNPEGIKLRLASKKELEKESNGERGNALGLTKQLYGVLGKRSIEEVLVNRNLPYIHVGRILAHEYGHVWTHLKGFERLAPQVIEGICELMSYLWLSRHVTLESIHHRRTISKNSDIIYGGGFKEAFVHYQNMGLLRLLQYVKKKNGFPN